jgi:hypothetical protein
MSFIVRSLERLFEAPEEIEKHDRAMKRAQAPAVPTDDDPPTFRCRVCRLEAAERAYCPTCLADTMEPMPRR